MNNKHATGLFGVAAAAVLFSLPAVAAGVAVDGRIHVAQGAAATYSDDQATSGKKRFNSDCAECHGEDLNGGLLGGPPLKGSAFEEHFFGAPASGLFQYMSSAMPPNDPGRFSATEYINMMAYILQKNGVQPGSPLPTNPDQLDNLTLEK